MLPQEVLVWRCEALANCLLLLERATLEARRGRAFDCLGVIILARCLRPAQIELVARWPLRGRAPCLGGAPPPFTEWQCIRQCTLGRSRALRSLDLPFGRCKSAG